jgi:hypothetical protein
VSQCLGHLLKDLFLRLVNAVFRHTWPITHKIPAAKDLGRSP